MKKIKILYINTFDPYKENHGGATVTRKELELISEIADVSVLFGSPLRTRFKRLDILKFLKDVLMGKSVKLASYSVLNKDASFYAPYDIIYCNHDMSAYDYQIFEQLKKPFIIRKLNAEYKFYSANKLFQKVERNRISLFEKEVGLSASSVIHLSSTEYAEDDYSKFKHLIFPPLLPTIHLSPNKSLENYNHSDRPIDLLCVTNYEWKPNMYGFDWFFANIAPKLSPNINIHLVGKGSDRYKMNRGVTSHGFVKDVDSFYRRSKIFIAPVLTGAGIKIKNLEAMVNGIPIITTPLGIDGIGDVYETGGAYIACSAEDFVNGIEILMSDEKKCCLQQIEAKKWILKNIPSENKWKHDMFCLLKSVVGNESFANR